MNWRTAHNHRRRAAKRQLKQARMQRFMPWQRDLVRTFEVWSMNLIKARLALLEFGRAVNTLSPRRGRRLCLRSDQYSAAMMHQPIRVRVTRETAAQLGVAGMREAMRHILGGFAKHGLLAEVVVPSKWGKESE